MRTGFKKVPEATGKNPLSFGDFWVPKNFDGAMRPRPLPNQSVGAFPRSFGAHLVHLVGQTSTVELPETPFSRRKFEETKLSLTPKSAISRGGRPLAANFFLSGVQNTSLFRFLSWTMMREGKEKRRERNQGTAHKIGGMVCFFLWAFLVPNLSFHRLQRNI